MENNANKIILAVGALMVVVLLGLVLSSGLNGGGGGGSSTPPAATPQDNSQQQQQQQPEQTPEATTSSSTGDDMTIDELEALIDQSAATKGENIRDAATSPSVPTASTVYQEVTQRGFENPAVEADFDINGTYSESHVLDANSSEKYPSYTMLYQSTQGVLWVLYVNDGAYIAVPVGSAAGSFSKEIILVESDVVVQYDGINNEFSDRSVSSFTNAAVVRVTSVDKATLDSYSVAQLEAM